MNSQNVEMTHLFVIPAFAGMTTFFYDSIEINFLK